MRGLLFVFFILTTFRLSAQIDIQGHRGARGLLPENSIAAFKKAVDLGVNTLEMDVVITGDKKVLVSHEPWLSAKICTDENGNPILEEKERAYNLYKLPYKTIARCDCGSKGNPNFPTQEKTPAFKPLLKDVIAEIEDYIVQKNYKPIRYNIEIKSLPQGDNLYHPEPETYVKMVVKQVKKLPAERVTLQSFDFRILQELNKNYPEYKLSALVENEQSAEENLKSLGFIPEVYSPYYKLLTQEVIQELHDLNIKVIPWTVNTEEEMIQMIEMGVDGLISDYPDRAMKIKKTNE
ncbi:MAG: glycerophosphodiester phosphodiesterase family protein [Cyclobacteriaceae bacterium]|nr:glycerophosphodiester phosphodiesterase family protein [Cyclobacteriaceae bacterium]